MNHDSEKADILGFDGPRLAALCGMLGEKPFRAGQLMRWVHQRGVVSFANMTDISKVSREKLDACSEILAPEVLFDRVAQDGTRKWLLDVGTGNGIETVFIPESDRGTLCISSQVGCALACSFCSTGRQGFNRNLTAAEIVGQLWLANRVLRTDSGMQRPISNVVMMGMGEPLTNFDAVVQAMRIMLDDHAYGLSRRRVTLSTSGIVPAMDRLRQACPVALAVSLHAPNDALRDVLVPINKKYPLSMLMQACQRYLLSAPRDFITFEYVMLEGVNDQPGHVKELIELVRDVPCKFNLIPFNPFPHSGYRSSSSRVIRSFRESLQESGFVVTIRKTRGEDIDAACGQLAGQVQDKSRRNVKIPITARV